MSVCSTSVLTLLLDLLRMDSYTLALLSVHLKHSFLCECE